MVKVNREYRDLDLNFEAHPVLGDVNILKEAEAVKRSIRNLILTDNYERFFNPELGSGITQLLFELVSPITERRIVTAITDTIVTYEPRADLIDVDVRVNEEQNGYTATITFYIVNLVDPISMFVFLERVR